jgi:hypothetical protein
MYRILPITRSRLLHGLLPWLAGGSALLLYASTAAPWLTWAHNGADGGDLIAAAMTGGVPHPSGYPTYCLLARLFALLPLGSIAHRFNLFSATLAAAAVALVYLTVLSLLNRDAKRDTWLNGIIALLAAWAFAASPTLWSQATIAEVYALNAFFFTLCLYLALRDDLLMPLPYWAFMGLALGLGLGGHMTLMLFCLAMIMFLWHKVTWPRFALLALGVLGGLCVYLYLPLAARGNPPVNWGNPSTWSGFWWVISGNPYHQYLFALPLQYLPARLGAWAHLWSQQYTWLGLMLALMGLWSWSEQGRRTLAWATGLTFVVYVLYAIGYDTTDSYVYLIPSYVLTALWIAEGAKTVLAMLAESLPRARRLSIALTLVLLAALPAWSIARNYRDMNLSRDQTVAAWVGQVLHTLPPGAVLITGTDAHTFALSYVQWIEHQRPDVLVVDGELLAQPWYAEQILQRYPPLREHGPKPTLEQLILTSLGQRDVYLANERESLAQGFEITRIGVLFRIERRQP